MSAFRVRVHGHPAPQGSKRCFCRNGRATVVESSSDRVKAWRAAVVAALQPIPASPHLTGPVHVDLEFYLPRPKAHRGAETHIKRPDVDKLVRATLDALTTARIYADDSQVDTLVVHKRYARAGEEPGAQIIVMESPCEP